VSRSVSTQARREEPLMTCDEVATFLQVSIASVRRWSRCRSIKALKIGSRGDWRYRYEDVLKYLSRGTEN